VTRPDPADLENILAIAESGEPLPRLERRMLAAEVVALRAELAEARASQFPEIDESLLPDGVSAASWDPVTLTARAEAHCRHAWDHNMEVKAWVVLTLLRERAAREAAERERDTIREQYLESNGHWDAMWSKEQERAEAAEAREQQLREALERLRDNAGEPRVDYPKALADQVETALGSAAAADKLDSCPHCGLKGKPFCWCGEHAPVREAAADSQENPT
jgi:hypothetical protein